MSDNDVRKEQIPDDITEAEEEALLSAAVSVKVSDLAAQSGAIANGRVFLQGNKKSIHWGY